MNLDTVIEILGRSSIIVAKRIEERRNASLTRDIWSNATDDSMFYMAGEPRIEDVLTDLHKITIFPEEESVIAYGKAIYKELYDRINSIQNRRIEGLIMDILKPFKEYSYSMFPDTMYQTILNTFGGATNESCTHYLYKPTPEMIADAKSIVIEHEKNNAYARGQYFEDYTGDILSKDIVIKTASYLKIYIVKFAVMLDCILLESGYDLLELQTLHNIKLIDEHKEVLLSKYIGSDGYAKQLLSKVCKTNTSYALKLKSVPELDTPKVRSYFVKAIELGLMKEDCGVYKWCKSNVLLALFLGIIICGDSIKETKYYGDKWHVTTKHFPDADLCKLFDVKNIGQQRVNNLDNERQKNPPRGYEEILKVFD